jgi:hypothetical protein
MKGGRMNGRIAGRWCRTTLIAAVFVVACTPHMRATPRPQRTTADPSRQQPPAAFACSRNDVTNYTGVVVAYTRETGRTVIRLRTDWETSEQVTLPHPGTDDPSPFFRMAGVPFAPADWTRIESRPGRVRPSIRATAWVCADGRVLVDWAVPRE